MSSASTCSDIRRAKIGKVGSYSSNGGFRIDGSVTQWWPTKPQAVAAAKSIGWLVKSVQPVYTRFQKGWGLGWGITKPGLLSRVEWAELTARFADQKKKPTPKRAKKLTAKELDRQKLEQLAAAEAMGDGLGALRDAEVAARKRGR